MNLKISFPCGILVVFLFLRSFGNTEFDLFQGFKACKFQDRKQLNTLENDSITKLHRSGECSPGFILNSYTHACTGSTIELNSRTALTYQWSPSDRFSNSTEQNPYMNIDSTRTYYLEITNYTNNHITNPDFELGNTGFITGYTYCDAGNCLIKLGDNGYSIGRHASDFESRFTGNDHTSGSGNFMIVNGARPLLTVWQQTISVKPNTKYAFGAWISTMITLSPAQIQFTINGSQIGSLCDAPDYANQWEQVFTTWNSGLSTSATIKIVDILPILVGNDFGLDDLFFGEIINCSDSISITASQNANLGSDTLIAPPDQQLVLAPTGGPFANYNWNTGDTTQSISINEPGRYWLAATDQNGCKSIDTISVKNSTTFIVFPNAFSPNADGSNDIFRPILSNISKFHMSVYNRWGQLMFETNDMVTGWDGLINGKKSPYGLYIFVADYEVQDDASIKSVRGSFTLIR